MLAEAIGAALAVEAGQDEADGGEVIVAALGAAEGVEELAKFGALNGRRLALLHPVEQAHHHTELCIRHFCLDQRQKQPKLLMESLEFFFHFQ